MGIPNYNIDDVPIKASKQEQQYIIQCNNQNFIGSALNIGNPHFVIFEDDIDNIDIHNNGILLNNSDRFPQGINVSYVQVLNKNEIRLKVYERGVGATLSCGSAACAAVSAGIMQNLLNTNVSVHFKHGYLTIKQNKDKSLVMLGKADLVYNGTINI